MPFNTNQTYNYRFGNYKHPLQTAFRLQLSLGVPNEVRANGIVIHL